MALDVREATKAKNFVELLTAGLAGTPPGFAASTTALPSMLFHKPESGLPTPTLALTEKFLLVGLSNTALADALARLQTSQPKLDGTPAFRAAEQTIATATSAYGYVDLRGLFERLYGTFRPLLAMSLAFMPDAGKYIDGSKLPATEVVQQASCADRYSQSKSPDGVLMESTGTITVIKRRSR
jgi:hypothetical protein